MNFLKNIASMAIIALLGIAAFFSQRAKTAQEQAKAAKQMRDIEHEANKTYARIQKNRAKLEQKHAQEIKNEYQKRRSSDRDQLDNNW